MSKVKKLMPEDKYLRMTVIFFVLGMIVRLAVFVLGDLSYYYDGDQKFLGALVSSLAIDNFVVAFSLFWVELMVSKQIGTELPMIVFLISTQLVNIVLDCFFVVAAYKQDKIFRPLLEFLANFYLLSYIISIIIGLIVFKIPYNILTVIAAVYYYNFKKNEI